MKELLLNKKGEKVMYLGNEAIIRGALESGVQFVSTYPGTPASEIGNNFYALSKELRADPKFYFEFSTNEKTATEAAIGADFSGLKTLVAYKNFGLNVALDALMPLAYTGSLAPMVVVVADDPSCHSSAQSEENTRPFSALSHIPMLEPSDAQECKDYVIEAFKISEKFGTPVMVRVTTRVAHQRAPVVLGELDPNRKVGLKGEFIKNKNKFVTMMPRLHGMKKEMLEREEKLRAYFEKSALNYVYLGSKDQKKPSPAAIAAAVKKAKIGIITSGISYLHALEALEALKLNIPVLKLGTFYPLPELKVKEFIKPLKKVLVLEELEPYLEKSVQMLAKDANCKLKIHGADLRSQIGEMKPETAAYAIANFAGRKYPLPVFKPGFEIPSRLPQLCPGCPYWLAFSAVKKAVDEKEVIFGGDIGCYMLGALPPHSLYDYMFCMGSSIGIAHGIKKATNQKVIAFIGDGTFFHAGIEGLLNAVYNGSNPLIIILNNQITAMTGHQPHPDSAGVEHPVPIEKVVEACGVKHLKIVDQGNQEEFIAAVKEMVGLPEVAVIIARRPCKFVKKD
ncbi:MAG TPA: thiamine pyrophosphate-dependent enzyme [Candidatus Paceibacterota bacterium]|nr:thiamine pyrophosphate-dependent enzyme [Candidatus Pacearchaeota archaeon]HRZ50733.1 thiamine pyrophosphate-dependent enzyme [Candidatus Paceibacterota bacterium]HSA36370.1 thiamine pyrophosphate-dependent enzyme [Candidatus Paceibacterota bacterium]